MAIVSQETVNYQLEMEYVSNAMKVLYWQMKGFVWYLTAWYRILENVYYVNKDMLRFVDYVKKIPQEKCAQYALWDIT